MRKCFFLIMIATGLMACKKKKNTSEANEPKQAELLFPQKSSVCIDGIIKSDSESIITFDWRDVEYATSYTLFVKDLIDNSGFSYSIPSWQSQQTLQLKRGRPYSWNIVTSTSVSEKTSQSETWMFYSSAEGVASFAPFPPELSAPANNLSFQRKAEVATVVLSWYSGDPDDDIVGFDVYMGKDLSPPLIRKNQSSSNFSIEVSDTGTYFWKVVAKDARGNSAESSMNSFHVY